MREQSTTGRAIAASAPLVRAAAEDALAPPTEHVERLAPLAELWTGLARLEELSRERHAEQPRQRLALLTSQQA